MKARVPTSWEYPLVWRRRANSPLQFGAQAANLCRTVMETCT